MPTYDLRPYPILIQNAALHCTHIFPTIRFQQPDLTGAAGNYRNQYSFGLKKLLFTSFGFELWKIQTLLNNSIYVVVVIVLCFVKIHLFVVLIIN